ncbi:MAG: hypothetical protein HKN34_12275, partial [Gammaproteobacteria bacterium]|nr:hypothetical protein [Gammaproteobacteria bacterium]
MKTIIKLFLTLKLLILLTACGGSDINKPVAILDITDLGGVALNNNQLSFGAGFILSGIDSIDEGSGIDSYEWTSLDADAGVIGTTPFLQNTPVTTTDDTATISFPDAKLAPGSYRFQLRVQDTAGNFSNPAVVTLIVVDDVAPTAVLNVHDGTTGQLLVNNTIGFGQSFILVGRFST